MRSWARRRAKGYDWSIFVPLKISVPKSILELLNKRGEELMLTYNRLINIAIDNELDSTYTFNYAVGEPDRYEPYMYAAEAQLLLKYLLDKPRGVSREMLMLLRRDIGIKDRQGLLGAIKQLHEDELITEEHLLKTSVYYSKLGKTKIKLKNNQQQPIKTASDNDNDIDDDFDIVIEDEGDQ